jgi:hypothetical protein
MKAKARNPKITMALERAFSRGVLGHQVKPPVSINDPLLIEWLSWHGGEVFSDGEAKDRVIGVFACFCDECYPFIAAFVCGANISLLAQGAGQESVFRNDDDHAEAQLQPISIHDQELEDRICERAALAARQVAEAILEGWRLKQEARAESARANPAQG